MTTDEKWFLLCLVLIALFTAMGFLALYWRGQLLNLKRERQRDE